MAELAYCSATSCLTAAVRCADPANTSVAEIARIHQFQEPARFVPWIQALGWAFKPSTVIDVRYLPKEEKIETEAMIAKLTGKASPAPAPAEIPPGSSTTS